MGLCEGQSVRGLIENKLSEDVSNTCSEQNFNKKWMVFTTWDLSGSSREPVGQLQESDEGQLFLEKGVERGKHRLTLLVVTFVFNCFASPPREAWHITQDTLISCMFLLSGGRPLGGRDKYYEQ